MTDTTGFENDEQGDEQGDQTNWRRDLERRAREGDKAKVELDTYRRREAMREAGLDPADKITSLFVQTYKGDLTPDAIKDAASEYGLIKSGDDTPPAPEDKEHPAQPAMDAIGKAAGSPVTMPVEVTKTLETAHKEGGNEALFDQLEKLGVAVTTRQ